MSVLVNSQGKVYVANGNALVANSATTPYREDTFNSSGNLTACTLHGYTTILPYAFYECTELTSITIPSGVTSIGSNAFAGCSSLASISLPSTLISIGYTAFHECAALTTIDLPSSLTTISAFAFKGCEGLTSLTLPTSLTTIGAGAFAGCKGMPSTYTLVIPQSVTSIEEQAFGYMAMGTVRFLGTPNSLGVNIFEVCDNLSDIYVPWSSSDTVNAHAPWGADSATIHYNS